MIMFDWSILCFGRKMTKGQRLFCTLIIIQIPRSVDDIKKIVQQLDELTKKIEDAKDLAMVIYL